MLPESPSLRRGSSYAVYIPKQTQCLPFGEDDCFMAYECGPLSSMQASRNVLAGVYRILGKPPISSHRYVHLVTLDRAGGKRWKPRRANGAALIIIYECIHGLSICTHDNHAEER
jgi:hypothetical protein